MLMLGRCLPHIVPNVLLAKREVTPLLQLLLLLLSSLYPLHYCYHHTMLLFLVWNRNTHSSKVKAAAAAPYKFWLSLLVKGAICRIICLWLIVIPWQRNAKIMSTYDMSVQCQIPQSSQTTNKSMNVHFESEFFFVALLKDMDRLKVIFCWWFIHFTICYCVKDLVMFTYKGLHPLLGLCHKAFPKDYQTCSVVLRSVQRLPGLL